MKKSRVLAILLCVFLMFTIAVTGCAKKEEKAEVKKEKVTLKLGHTGAPDHHYQTGSLMFAKLVSEKTGGMVEIKVFPSDQLGKQKELVEGAQLGTVDMVLTSDVLLSSFEPKIGMLNLPFLFEDYKHLKTVLNGPIGDKISAALENKGLKVVSYWENGFRHITNSRGPINKPEDLKGLKVRTPSGAVFVDTFNMMGANATPMSFGELYSALQLKTVDGQENPTTHVLTQKFYEVQSYLSLTNHIHVSEPLIISKKVYDNLDPEYQKALLEAGKEVAEWMFDEVSANEAAEIEEIKKHGMKVNQADIDAFVEGTKKVYEKYEPVFGKDLIEEIRKAAN